MSCWHLKDHQRPVRSLSCRGMNWAKKRPDGAGRRSA